MAVVPDFRFILNVSDTNCNAFHFFFWSFVNIVILLPFRQAFVSQNGGNSSCKRCFPLINVTNGANINVRFRHLDKGFQSIGVTKEW